MTDSFHGTECAFFGAGQDLKPFLKSISVSGERGNYDASALANLWRVFRAGRVSGELQGEGFHSTGAGEFSEISQAIHGTRQVFMLMPEGDVVGSVFAGIDGNVISRAIDSKLTDMTMAVLGVTGKKGADLGVVLHDNGTAITATGDSAIFDGLAPSDHGGAFYVICTAYTGTAANLGIKLQDSADGITFADIVGMPTIDNADIAAGFGVRVSIPKGVTVRQHVKVVFTDVGALTSANVLCGYSRYYD